MAIIPLEVAVEGNLGLLIPKNSLMLASEGFLTGPDPTFSPPIGDATQGRLLARKDDVIMMPLDVPGMFAPTDKPAMSPEDDTLMWARDEDDQIFEPVGDPVLMEAAPDVSELVVEEEPTVFFPDEEDGTVFEPEPDSTIFVVPEDPSLGEPDE